MSIRRLLSVLNHGHGLRQLDRGELVRRIEFDRDLQLHRSELSQADLFVAARRIRGRAKRLAFLEVDARGLEFCALHVHRVAHVVRIDLQRLLVLDDGVIPILDAFRAAAAFVSVVARATGGHDERNQRHCDFS